MASIRMRDVVIDYPLYGYERSLRTTLKRTVGGMIQRETDRNKRVYVRALHVPELNIEHGDRVGIIGHNGAGKSTLLRLCAGVYEPTQGEVTIDGKLSSLFTYAPGMDFEDTGYENIQTCGLLLGMTRDEIKRKLPYIEEFSELSEFLRLPVRTYSSGMTVRLGFSLATSIDPEILILDEMFGAGDQKFAVKARDRVMDLVNRAHILLFASHSTVLIKEMCTKAILLHSGEVVAQGEVDPVLEKYQEMVNQGLLDSA